MTSSETIDSLHTANQRLRSILNRARSPSFLSSIGAADFAGLRREIQRASQLIRNSRPDWVSDQDLRAAVMDYCRGLKEFAEFLPLVQMMLEARRKRLQVALDHLQAAALWWQARSDSL
jgi:hypothetical protein